MTANTMADTYSRLEAAAELIRSISSIRPRIGVVLGSGLGALSESVEIESRIPYGDIPHMPISTAPGHAGTLLLGRLEEQEVALLSGRAHLYEGYEVGQAVFGVRLLRHLGADILIVTNAAGGVNLSFTPGLLMLITDHINLTGRNPLVGPADARLGLRFPDMSEA